MFGTIRKHSQALWIPIIIVIVISFVVYFTPGFDPLDNRGNQQSETDNELKYARQQVLLGQAMAARDRVFTQMQYMPPEQREGLMQYIPGMIDQALSEVSGRMSRMRPMHLMDKYPTNQQQFADLEDNESLDDYPMLDYQAQLRILQLKKARDLGIMVGLNTAVVRVENMFSQPGSGFSQTAYDNFLLQFQKGGFLASGDAGKEQLREFIREDIMMRQLNELMTRSSGFFPDSAVEATLTEANKKYTAQAVFFSSSNHLASVTNAIDANSTLISKHLETMADQYRIEPKRTIGYVKVSNAHYLSQAEEKVNFATLVTNRIKLHHSSTNVTEFFTDNNSTKKLPDGPALIAAARADVREKQQVPVNKLMHESSEKEAKAFFRHIFENQPEEDWTLTRLKQESSAWKGEDKQPLHYKEANVSRYGENPALPKSLVESVYGGINPDSRKRIDPFATAAEGTLYPRLIEVPDDGFYLIGLVGNIDGRPRKFDELSDKERGEVKESFINKESARLTEEDAHDFREGIEELMKTGQSFADSIRLSPNPTVILPSMKLGGTNQVAELEGLATLKQIHNAISTKAKLDEVKAGWTSKFTSAVNEKSDGFLVHVSAVEAGEPPTPAELQSAAKSKRQEVRENYSNWIAADIRTLHTSLYIGKLQQRLDNIEFDIKSKQEEAAETSRIVAEIESGKRSIDAETLAGLKSDLAEAQQQILNLNEMSQALPRYIKEASGVSSDSGDTKK